MTRLTWPTQAKIARLDLRLSSPQQTATSPLNGRQMRGARLSELWTGNVVLAPRLRADLEALSAFVENLRGRSGVFTMPLAAGFATTDGAGNATVVSAAAGARIITLDFVTTGVTLAKGTLIQIGELADTDFQLLEVLADVTTADSTVVTVAPALRKSFSPDTAVKTSDVVGRFRLAKDDTGAGSFGLGYGSVSLAIVEAPIVDNGTDYLLDDDYCPLLDDDGVTYLTDGG